MDLVADPCDEISSPHASDTYEHRSCFYRKWTPSQTVRKLVLSRETHRDGK